MNHRIRAVTFLLAIFCGTTNGVFSQAIKAQADPGYVDKVNQESIAIADLKSDDFSDLQFLKNTLAEMRIVYLGESNHHTESYNILKYRLLRFLHRELGFKVVAFESSIYSCAHSNLVKDSLNSFYILTHSLLGAWRTPVVADMLNYMKVNSMSLAGFDPNPNALTLEKKYYAALVPGDNQLGAKLYQVDSSIQVFQHQRYKYFAQKKADVSVEQQLDDAQEKLKGNLIQIKSDLKKVAGQEDKTIQLLAKLVSNKIALLSCSNRLNDDYQLKYITDKRREDLMASNLRFLVDTLYKNEKIIVWGHNTHISKGGASTITEDKHAFLNNSMGSQMNKFYGDISYHMAFFGFPGTIGRGNSKEVDQLNEARKNSLEAIMYHSDKDICFLPLSRDKLPFFNKPMVNFTELNYTDTSILTDCYDGLIFIKNLSPSVLIQLHEKEYYEKKYGVR